MSFFSTSSFPIINSLASSPSATFVSIQRVYQMRHQKCILIHENIHTGQHYVMQTGIQSYLFFDFHHMVSL